MRLFVDGKGGYVCECSGCTGDWVVGCIYITMNT